MTNKEKVFDPELRQIKSEAHRKVAEYLINTVLPDYFFVIRPSSSGKYHHRCTMRDGGLVIHTKRLIHLALHMAEADGRGPDEKDLIIIAGIMHDAGKKSGYSSSDKYSYHDHPIEAVDMIKEHEDRLIKYASVSDLQKIYNMIYFHMGRWTPESMNKDMADFGKLEHLLYYADYLSSRKDLDTPVDNFDVTLEDPEDALRTLETINEGVR